MFSLLFYRLFFLLLLPLLVIALLVRSRRNPDYRKRLTERLGISPSHIKPGGIVLHAASVGEVIALKHFIEQLLASYPDIPLTVTTFTPTGSAQVRKLFGDNVQHCYLPIDVMPCSYLFLTRLKPQLMIFMETELWPNLIAQSQSRNIKLLLINGRLSQKSVTSYSKIKALIKPTLNRFDKILCQSQGNMENFLHLGCQTHRTQVSGNLKFDISINDELNAKQAELAKYCAFTEINPRKVWLVASTHPGDESLVLSAFKLIKQQHNDALLIIVPRHPERFNDVANLCLSHNFTLAKRSEKTIVSQQDIWLLDTLGELMAAFALADVVTMGGSFSEVGGHNPLEPALFKKPIVVGSNMSNFTEVLAQLKNQQGIIQLSDEALSEQLESTSTELAECVSSLFLDAKQRQQLGENAHQVVLANQGASQLSLDYVQDLMAR